jgi:hypothetical protein
MSQEKSAVSSRKEARLVVGFSERKNFVSGILGDMTEKLILFRTRNK